MSETTEPASTERGPCGPPGAPRIKAWQALLCLQAIFWTQYPWIRSTNFGGTDEWVLIALLSKGIIAMPHSNRPLGLLPSLPAAMVAPHSLTSYYVVQAFYLSFSGWLAFLLCRRLVPQLPVVALLAGAFTMVWAPRDTLRLNSVMAVGYGGLTFAVLLATLLLVESWLRRKWWLLTLGTLVAYVTVRIAESALPLLLGAPIVLFALRRDGRSRLRWLALWGAVMAVASSQVLLPFLSSTEETSYQRLGLGIDWNPQHAFERLLRLYRLHLFPVVTSAPAELAVLAVPAAVAVFGLAYALAARRGAAVPAGPEHRGVLARLALAGLVAAGLGYSPYALTDGVRGAARTQFLSSPGIALVLGSGACLLATWFPPRWRQAALATLGAWMIAVATGRTVAMQAFWDYFSTHPAQNRMLVKLTDALPDLKAHTLVVLVDDGKTWDASFTFWHAVRYLYQGHAAGHVWGAWDIFYPTSFEADGIHSDPWPVLREAWDSPATVYRYDETIALHRVRSGELTMLERWPETLPPLPPGTRYDPGARIVTGTPPPAERGLLVR